MASKTSIKKAPRTSKARMNKASLDIQTLNILLKDNQHPIWIYDRDSLTFLEVNDAALNIFGYSHAAFKRTTVKEILPRKEVNHLLADFERARPTLQHSSEWRHFLKDRSMVDAEVTSHLLKFNGRNAVLVIAEDITERKRAEERLRLSEEQYRNLFNHLPIPAFTKDINGIYTSSNEENLKYWATNPIGHTDAELLPNETAAALRAIDQSVIKSGAAVSSEELLPDTPMGNRQCISIKAPLRDVRGNIIGILGASLDITERKQSEEAVRRSEDYLRTVIDATPALIWSAQPDGSLDFINRRHREFTGLTLEDVGGWRWTAVIHPEDRERLIEQWHTQLATGEELTTEARLRRASGDYRWLLIRALPLRDESGTIVRWYGTKTDIEDRKQAEAALRQRESDLAESQRVARLGSWSLDLATNTVRLSGELYRIFDVEITTFGGTYESLLSAIHPDDRDRVRQVHAQAKLSGEPFQVEYCVTTRSGKLTHILEVGYVRKDGTGAASALFGCAQDVTERKRVEAERERLFGALQLSHQQLKVLARRLVDVQESGRRRLAREIHDDVSQMLTALMMQLGTAKSVLPKSAQSAHTILEQTEELVEKIMERTRSIIADLRPPVLDDLGLVPALRRLGYGLKESTGAAIKIKAARFPERLPMPIEVALFRIAQEACANIRKHARARRVTISLAEEWGRVVLAVQDDGVGFDMQNNRSRQSDDIVIDDDLVVPASHFGFIGIQERVAQLGGTFQVKSKPGEGTTIRVEMPL